MFDFYYQIGTHRRKLFQAVGSHCSIGSARSNDLVIDSRQLSKRQAELRLEDSGVYIRDLGSLTGCWVNRERVVERGPLSDLDEIEIGDVRVTLKAIRLPLTPMSNAGSAEDWPEKVSNTNQHTTEQTVLQPSDDQPSEDHSIMPSPHDEALAYWGRIVHEQLLFQMDLQRKDVNRMSDESLRRESLDLIKNIVAGLHDQLPESVDHEQLISNVLNESVGLGPLEEFLQDESITEIMVNNYREIFIERNGKLEQSRVTFSSDATVSAVIDRIISPLGRRIDESSPIVDARLKDGSRVNAIIPPLALKGPSLTIRKFPKNRLKFSDLVASDAISQSMVDFLKVCVEMRKNIIVSGGTGSGKTTLLNVLSNFIPATDRIVTIEDAAELKLAQPNLVSLESRPPNLEGRGEIPIRDLVRNSLRMRPDRIVVGECRGGEALDMLQAMNTGHNGSLTTIHANNPRDVLSRLEVLVLMAGMELPISAIREQVASAVDLIIQQTRFPCGARKITKITEVVGVESGTVQLQDIFTYGQRGVDDQGRVKGNFVATGAIPTFYEELRNLGYEVDLSSFSSATERVHA
ncbi:ATPase, T2SS/T4P/T4SS family [Granulosicoccus sp.]|nr:ATPase, T2SS/T4P/T4SS family [Granulosicoccus sp.]MDB4222397.1 ATPase, T2SS/T4P/T4SS family [Granulosicoccus sp.]